MLEELRWGGVYILRALPDPPPGNMVMWRGLSRLTDIELGAIIGAKLVGNCKPLFCVTIPLSSPYL